MGLDCYGLGLGFFQRAIVARLSSLPRGVVMDCTGHCYTDIHEGQYYIRTSLRKLVTDLTFLIAGPRSSVIVRSHRQIM